MNFHDIIPVEPEAGGARYTPETKAKVEQALEIKDVLPRLAQAGEYLPREDVRKINVAEDYLAGRMNTFREEIIIESGRLPVGLQHVDDVFTRIAKTPRVALQTVREIAERVGFLVIPFSYVEKMAYAEESLELKRAIAGFQSSLEKWFDVYAIVPLGYYSVSEHVRAKNDCEIYAPKDLQSALLAVSMMIPTMRMVFRQLADLRGKVSDIDVRVTNAESELRSIAQRLRQLEKLFEEQRLEELRARRRTEAQAAELRRIDRLFQEEPMMFAVRKGVSLTDSGLALVGPCWGPDFPDIVLAGLGFTKIRGQRKVLSSHALSWK
ncbi:hypothetical protein L0Y69_01080 [bacterium]|nr:hypothetical protein [bacterium]